jgi:hypothetical protein
MGGAMLGTFQYIGLRSLSKGAWFWIPTTSFFWGFSRGFFRSMEWPRILSEVYEMLDISSDGVWLLGPTKLGDRISIAVGEGLIIGLGTGLLLWFIIYKAVKIHKAQTGLVDAAKQIVESDPLFCRQT